MNELAIYDQFEDYIPLENGISRKYNKYLIAGATPYHYKVNGHGIILLQHLKGAIWDLWITHYLFTRPTTLFTRGHVKGVEIQSMIEGHTLICDENAIWHHFDEGDHHIVYNTQIDNEIRCAKTPMVTLSIRMGVKDFQQSVARLPKTKWLLKRLNSDKAATELKTLGMPNVGMHAFTIELFLQLQAGHFDLNGQEQLRHEMIKQIICNNSEHCVYKYSSEDIRRILDTKANLKLNLTVKRSVSELFQYSLMGKKKFTEGFKLVTGFPPATFILSEKIKLSKQMMEKQTDLSNDDFALILGFASASHFSKTFRKYEGISPKDYMKNIK